MSIFYFLLPFKTNFEMYFVQFVKDCRAQVCCPALSIICVVGWFFSFLLETGNRTLN